MKTDIAPESELKETPRNESIPCHEVASIFPEMDATDYRDLVKSIATVGLREPIWLHEGKIIDGKHRYKACLETRTEPKFRNWDGQGSLVEFVVSLNLYRRHLTASQRAVIALKIVPMLEAEARERQGTRTDIPDIREKFPKSSFGRANDKATEIVKGTNSRYVQEAAKIRKEDPEILELVEQGKVSIPTAKRLIDLPPEERMKACQDFEQGGGGSVSKTLRRKENDPSPEKALEELKRWYKRYHQIGDPVPGFEKFGGVFSEIGLLIHPENCRSIGDDYVRKSISHLCDWMDAEGIRDPQERERRIDGILTKIKQGMLEELLPARKEENGDLEGVPGPEETVGGGSIQESPPLPHESA